MSVGIVTYYLEMTEPGQLVRPGRELAGLEIRRVGRPSPELNRFFYTTVGADWQWTDRLAWDESRWLQHLQQRGVETWVAYLDEEQAGYYELESLPETGVEIAYFGLLPAFIARGVGGLLLAHAIDHAWQLEPARVWVHTCTLDHPAALANYRARGFELYREETSERVPDQKGLPKNR